MTRVTLCGPLRCGELLRAGRTCISSLDRRGVLCCLACWAAFFGPRHAAWPPRWPPFWSRPRCPPDFFSRASFFLRSRALRSLLEPLQARLSRLVSATCEIGFLAVTFLGPDLGLGKSVVMHQRDMRRADIGAAAALDAVEQVVFLHLVEIVCTRMPEELLRQQLRRDRPGRTRRSGCRGVPVACRGLLARQGQQAVAGLGHRHLVGVQRETHHGSAEQQLLCLVAVAARLRDHEVDRCTQGDAKVARLHAHPGRSR